MIKAIVIGGSGFLGSELCNQLSASGVNVLSVDNLTTGNHAFLRDSVDRVTGDANDPEFINNTIDTYHPTHIYYLAALHHIPSAELNPHFCISSNVMALSNVLAQLSKRDTPLSFAFASTGGVYKDLSETPLDEQSPLDPIGIYPLTKFWGEQLISYYQEKYADIFSFTVFRLFNLVGKNETNDHLVPAILSQLKCRPSTLFHGNLRPKRDYIHVADAAKALLLWSQSIKQPIPTHINICSGTEYSVQEVINLCMEVTDCYPSLALDPSRLRCNR